MATQIGSFAKTQARESTTLRPDEKLGKPLPERMVKLPQGRRSEAA
jgi:hypothetical protein